MVVAFPVSPSALEGLRSSLGPDFDVLDIRAAPVESDLVVCLPCSPGAIMMLKRTFPGAQVVVVGPVDSDGAIARMCDAGADQYLARPSQAQLATAIRRRVGPAPVEATLVCHRHLAA